MEYLHGEQVVHGDLKSKNILISQFDISRDAGQFIVVKVADFGNAKVCEYREVWAHSPTSFALYYRTVDILNIMLSIFTQSRIDWKCGSMSCPMFWFWFGKFGKWTNTFVHSFRVVDAEGKLRPFQLQAGNHQVVPARSPPVQRVEEFLFGAPFQSWCVQLWPHSLWGSYGAGDFWRSTKTSQTEGRDYGQWL